jgi:hypothetical protein
MHLEGFEECCPTLAQQAHLVLLKEHGLLMRKIGCLTN